ncbi:MAG: radical SAM protein [bacterium]|nr:radical SAM protein [bacterium]
MNILILNPPFKGKFSREQRSPAITKSGTFYYPMWIAYATGILEQNGYNVKLIDAPANLLGINDVLKIAQSFKPSLIVLDTSTPSIYNDVKIGDTLKETFPDSIIVLVGPHVSATAEETLKLSTKIDIICHGEYDYTLKDIADAIQNNTHKKLYEAFNEIAGISFQKNGNIIHTPHRPFIEDLDKLPFVSSVYKKHLDYTQYFYAHSQYPIVTIIGGRGCPHRCVYCVYPQTFSGRILRYRSIKNIVDELEYIVKEFKNLKEVMFEDDTLTVNRVRCREFCKEILSRNLKIVWSCNSRADVDYDTLKLMKLAGCRLMCVGFESGNEQILKNMKKGVKLEKMFDFMQSARKAKILVHGCFMIGNPGDSRLTIQNTLNFAKKLNPDTAQFFPIMVYPGTEAYEWVKNSGYLRVSNYSDWLTDEGLHNCVVDLPNLSHQDMVKFCNYARKNFYLRSSYITTKLLQSIKNPTEGKRIFKSFKTFIRHLIRT